MDGDARHAIPAAHHSSIAIARADGFRDAFLDSFRRDIHAQHSFAELAASGAQPRVACFVPSQITFAAHRLSTSRQDAFYCRCRPAIVVYQQVSRMLIFQLQRAEYTVAAACRHCARRRNAAT